MGFCYKFGPIFQPLFLFTEGPIWEIYEHLINDQMMHAEIIQEAKWKVTDASKLIMYIIRHKNYGSILEKYLGFVILRDKIIKDCKMCYINSFF